MNSMCSGALASAGQLVERLWSGVGAVGEMTDHAHPVHSYPQSVQLVKSGKR
jgi:hypothetical protein